MKLIRNWNFLFKQVVEDGIQLGVIASDDDLGGTESEDSDLDDPEIILSQKHIQKSRYPTTAESGGSTVEQQQSD